MEWFSLPWETFLLAVSITESIYLTFYIKRATLLDKCTLPFSGLWFEIFPVNVLIICRNTPESLLLGLRCGLLFCFVLYFPHSSDGVDYACSTVLKSTCPDLPRPHLREKNLGHTPQKGAFILSRHIPPRKWLSLCRTALNSSWASAGVFQCL